MCKIYWKNNACTLRHPIDPSKCAYRSQLMNTHICKLKRLYQTLCAYGDKAQNFGHTVVSHIYTCDRAQNILNFVQPLQNLIL